jgi:hypothetical protein
VKIVLALLLVSTAAAAQTADAGVAHAGAADAGSASTADGGAGIFDLAVDMDDNVNLQGGSELAAGVDPNAGQEIVHPGNMSDLQAGLRKVGSAFQSGNGAVALELNPYLLLGAKDLSYHQLTALHDKWYGRFATDLSTTIALAAGSPFSTDDQSRFSTAGFGVAIELLGNRSVYSKAYDDCLNGQKAQDERVKLILGELPFTLTQHKPNETDDEFYARVKAAIAANPRLAKQSPDLNALVEAEKKRVSSCRGTLAQETNALYFSTGARWVTPGTSRESGDAVVRVQREFVGMAYEFHFPYGIHLTGQGRLLAERPTQSDVLRASLDLGGALQWAGKTFALTAEAVQSVYKFDGSPGAGSVAGTLKLNLPSQIVLNIGVQGKGNDVGTALHQIAGTIAISYKDSKVANQSFDLSKIK